MVWISNSLLALSLSAIIYRMKKKKQAHPAINIPGREQLKKIANDVIATVNGIATIDRKLPLILCANIIFYTFL